MRERGRVAAHVAARHAGRIAGADERTDRGAGDRDRPHSELVERLDHGDMRDAACAAAAERERKAFHAAVSCANCQALAASGLTMAAMLAAFSLVAVPSRTRPAMPCMMAATRKKLYAR